MDLVVETVVILAALTNLIDTRAACSAITCTISIRSSSI